MVGQQNETGETNNEILFGAGNSKSARIINFQDGASDNIGGLKFNVFSGATETNAITVLSGGNVGIGTTAPAEKLHVYIAGNDIPLRIQTDSHVGMEIKGGTAHDIYFLLADTSTNAKMGWDHSATALKFNASASFSDNHLVVKSTGVGIGTDAPDTLLDLQAAAGADMLLRRAVGDTSSNLGVISFGNADVDKYLAQIKAVQDGATDSARLEFQTEVAGGAKATRMTIKSDGKVGIGTDDPSFTLHANHTNGGVIGLTRTAGSNTGVLGNIRFGNTDVDC